MMGADRMEMIMMFSTVSTVEDFRDFKSKSWSLKLILAYCYSVKDTSELNV